MNRYNFTIPIQMFVEEGLTDSDGEPLARPLGEKHISLFVYAEDAAEAETSISDTLQAILSDRNGLFLPEMDYRERRK